MLKSVYDDYNAGSPEQSIAFGGKICFKEDSIMNRKKWTAVLMTVLLLFQVLAGAVHAEEQVGIVLGGSLRIAGLAYTGSTLSADFSSMEPEGLTYEDVAFRWTVRGSGTDRVISEESSCVLTDDLVGCQIELTAAGRPEKGFSGTLSAKTGPVASTKQEAETQTAAEGKAPENDTGTAEGSSEGAETGKNGSAGEEFDESEAEYYTEGTESAEGMESAEGTESTESAEGTEGAEGQEGTESTEGAEEPAGSEGMDGSEGTESWPEDGSDIKNPASYTDGSSGQEYSTEDAEYSDPDYTTSMEAANEVYYVYDPLTGQETTIKDDVGQADTSGTGETSGGDGTAAPGEPGNEESANPETIPWNEETVNPEEPLNNYGTELPPEDGGSYQAEASVDSESGELNFGTVPEDALENADVQFFTVTNTGSGALHFGSIAPEHFMVGDITEALEPGESVQLFIQPRTGVEPGEYRDEIVYQSEEGAEVSVVASVRVEEGEVSQNVDSTGNPDGSGTGNTEETVTTIQVPVSLEVSPLTLSFGTVKEGYETAPEAQTVTVTNTGSTAVVLNQPEDTFFTFSMPETLQIAPGESCAFKVQPMQGLPAGEYTAMPEIGYQYIIPEEYVGNEHVVMTGTDQTYTVTLSFLVEEAEAEKICRITLDRSEADFGEMEADYPDPPKAQTVTVTNAGNIPVTLKQPSAVNFQIGDLTKTAIEPGESSTFTIAPNTGLSQGQYFETVTVYGNGESYASVNASFAVKAKTLNITGIVTPSEISGIANGSAKTAQALGLPETVTIKTTNGDMTAAVSWDTAGCMYDPSVQTAQSFTVNGKVSLPAGMNNPDELPLLAAVSVTVNARNPIVPDVSENQIIGVGSGAAFTTEDKISFSAAGAGCENSAPVQGDVRYVPHSWNVLENRIWDCKPFSASFRMGQGGGYELAVTFLQQQYNGNSWVNTGGQDIKKVSFNVRAVQTATMTPVPGQVRAARTGDDNSIFPMVLIFGASAAAIAAAVVIILKRRKR